MAGTPPGGRRSRVETRALTPHDDTPNTTTGNPLTVGSPNPPGGDPNGVLVEDAPSAPPIPPSFLHASRWSGYPAEWAPPLFRQLDDLTDVAWQALDLNSGVVASMPAYLVGASPSLPTEWLTNPDERHYESWADFARQLMWDFQLGEAFVVATARYANGWPARFHLLPPWTVQVEWGDGGRRSYTVGALKLDPDDVLHLRYKSTVDNLRGVGPLDSGRARMVAAQVLMRYATNYALGGGIPTSILKHPEELTAKQTAELQDQWLQARMSSIGLPAVLSGGVTWEAVQTDPLAGALTELASYTESRIAVGLGVPPFLLGLPSGGDSLTYSTTVQLFDYHWRAGLRPKVQRLMMGLSNWLLPRGTTIELNRDEYVRPGPLERAQTWEILNRIGVLSIDEIRAAERFGIATGPPPVTTESML